MKTIYLVACVAQKAEKPQPAEDLYISDWFRKARSYVKCQMGPQDGWYILSAKYHLVAPSRVIFPYNETLNTMGKRDRLQWGSSVLSQLLLIANTRDVIVMLAGSRYREVLEPGLRARGFTVDVPMLGLKIGEQKAWLPGHTVREAQL